MSNHLSGKYHPGYKHGGHVGGTSKEYSSWQKMKARCYNPRNNRYARYGARGITVCERWLNSFENFIADMGKCPAGCSLDRKDNDQGYSPDNCKWSTASEQARNRSTSRPVTFNGRTQLISDWAAELGIDKRVLDCRFRRGWSVDRALTAGNLNPWKHKPQLSVAE